MVPPSPLDEQHDRPSANQRATRAVALGVIAVLTVVLAGTIYLRTTSGAHAPSGSAAAINHNLVSTTALEYEFITPVLGWALIGVYGNAFGVGPPEPLHFMVFRTTDGAKHWQRQLAGVAQARLGQPETIDFVDQSTGFVFLGGSPAQLFRTADAGAHWLPVKALPAADVRQVGFTDAAHGWLVSGDQLPGPVSFSPSPSRLFATDDGGASWRSLPEPPRDVAVAAFRNQTEVWMGGTGAGRPYVYTSTDAGLTWQRRYLPPPPGQTWTTDPSQGPAVLMPATVDVLPDVGEVASVIDFGERFLFTTADTGKTWSYVPSPPGPVAYVDSQHWWAFKDTSLYKSADGGRSWTFASNALPTSLTAIKVLDSNHAWATQIVVGGYGLVTSSDAGIHWSRVSVPNPD